MTWRPHPAALAALAVLSVSHPAFARDCSEGAHVATVEPSAMRWDSVAVCDGPSSSAPVELRFAYPLPRGARIETPGITCQRENGAIVGITASASALEGGTELRFRTTVPRPSREESVRITPPLLRIAEPQLVGFRDRSLSFVPDSHHAPRVGRMNLVYIGGAEEGSSASSVLRLRRLGAHGDRMLVVADGVVRERGGLVGTLVSRSKRHHGLRAVLAGIALLVLGAAVRLYRRLAAAAELEEAEAVLRDEIDRLEASTRT